MQLYHALETLDNYGKLMVKLKVQAQTEFSLPDGKRKTRTKEVVSELIKQEMGLHTDEGQRKRGFLHATWTARCNELMAEDSCLLEFDKLKAGVKLQLWTKPVDKMLICLCQFEMKFASCILPQIPPPSPKAMLLN